MVCVKIPRALASGVALFFLWGCSKSGEDLQAVKEDSEAKVAAADMLAREASSEAKPEVDAKGIVPPTGALDPPKTKPRCPIDPRARAMMAELARSPLDMDRLLSGILEKYELDQIDDPKLQLAELLKQYEAGDLSVILDLGLLVAYGDPNIIDPAQAKVFLEEAAENGEARALAELGRLYLSGMGAERDGEVARSYFEQAMTAGDPEGAFLLAMGYRNGLWGERDEASGRTLLETAASMGHVAAANTLFALAALPQEEETDGMSKEEVRELVKNSLLAEAEMEAWLINGTEQGDLESMLNLSSFYVTTGEPTKAVPVLETAAELGSFVALNNLMGLSARQFRDEAFREKVKALLLPHAESGPSVGEARYRLAMIEAFNGPNSDDEVRRLLREALDARYYRAEIALTAMDEGAMTSQAFRLSMRVSDSEAYIKHTNASEVTRPKEAEEKANDQILYVDSAPVLTKFVVPKYPHELAADGIDGKVVVEVIIGPDGKVAKGRIVESTHMAFDDPALEAAKKMEFTPAQREGKPMPVKIWVPMIFTPRR